MKSILLFLSVLGIHISAFCQTISHQIPVNSTENPCISDSLYAQIERQIAQNRKLLNLSSTAPLLSNLTPLEWPLRTANGLNDCGYYLISAHVDLNTASGSVQDWNCGSKTYDGHRGNDIVPWPFIWDKMDHNQVEVIAAASGKIIAKTDTAFDRVCKPNGKETNNYISIQHADGSVALYVHIKKGSLTTKKIGETVNVGEYLGTIGSAGQSTGAHLHFEIRADGTFANYIDPFAGSCNKGITQSWWVNQKPYKEPDLLKLSIHSKWPYMGVCPNTTDTLYEIDTIIAKSGASVVFYACSKDVTTGNTWNFKIVDSKNKVVDSWDYTSTSTRSNSTLGWDKNLPTVPGKYTYQGTFNGKTCFKEFVIVTPVGIQLLTNQTKIKVTQNPSCHSFKVNLADMPTANTIFQITNSLGQQVTNYSLFDEATELPLPINSGFYLYQLFTDNQLVALGKLIVTK
jgi:murein DD-endopeptidase MepM/ murein hydrolase activator NlpD